MGIVKEVEEFVIKYTEEHIPESFVYHSIEHSRFVANMASKIALAEGVSKTDFEIVTISAWFHDLGYAKSQQDHEEEGCKIARGFLSEKDVGESFIQQVENCIRATKLGVEPKTISEKILSDADLSHSGMDNFMELSNLYRKEICNLDSTKCSKLDYWQKTLGFLKKISFHTNYAKENLDGVKTNQH